MIHSLVVALIVSAVSVPALAADREAADKGQCRLSFARSLRAFSVSLAFRSGICHRDRLRGKLSADIDCNDPWSWTEASYPRGAGRLDRDLRRFAAESAHCTPTIDTTEEVGYTSCPAPCEALPVTTFPELGDCLVCIARDATPTYLNAIVGTPPVSGDRDARRCEIAVGHNVSRYLHKRKKLQNGCEFLTEIAKNGFVGVDCVDIGAPGHPYERRINRLRGRVVDQVRRKCAKADLAATLDLCDDDVTAAGECVASLVDDWAAQIHPSAFPPLP